MTKPNAGVCPHCGAILAKPKQDGSEVPVSEALPEEREYDRRGVLLPRRTRVGGIIIPQ